MLKLISVITCVYNQKPEYFKECVNSVLQQTGPLEWIVVDDGSDTGLLAVYEDCLRHTATDHKFTLIPLRENVGLARARNGGIRQANGEWVVVLDSDDLLSPSLADELRGMPKNAKLACFAVQYFGAEFVENRPVSRWRDLYRRFGRTSADPFLWFDFYYHGIIAKLDLVRGIGGYDDALELGEDQDILLRACEAQTIENVVFCDQIGYRYRRNPDGVCALRWKEVERNYGATMVAGARRRGADFSQCRFSGTRGFDGAQIDTYTYRSGEQWLTWENHLANLGWDEMSTFAPAHNSDI